tara:strand:- start:1674 stop:3125 length:1452 start_codon:yes stop_codon:yes gene_type:complete
MRIFLQSLIEYVENLITVEIGSDPNTGDPLRRNWYVNRDDPRNSLATSQGTQDLERDQPLYSHPVLGDHVHYRLNFPSDEIRQSILAQTSNIKWTAEPMEGYDDLSTITGPESSADYEWIIDGRSYQLDWKPGKYKVKAEITLHSGISFFAEYEQEIGVRTDDVLAIAWIDPDQVTLNTSGVQSVLLQTLPVGGISESDSNDVKVFAGEFIRMLKDGVDLSSEFEVDPTIFGIDSPVHEGRDFTAFSQADRDYTLFWMFKYAGNDAPPTDFLVDNHISNSEIESYLSSNERTNFKLANHYQIKSLIDSSKQFSQGTLESIDNKVFLGDTKDPIKIYSLSGAEGWIGSFIASWDGYPSNGVFPGLECDRNSNEPTSTTTETKLCNEGTPDQDALDAFKTITGEDQGCIWSSITFYSDPSHYNPTTSSFTGQTLTRNPLPSSYENARINTQAYPTYWIYINGEKVSEQNQDPVPNALFPNTDRCE